MDKHQTRLVKMMSIGLIFTLMAGVIVPAMAESEGAETGFDVEATTEDEIAEREEAPAKPEEIPDSEEPAEEMAEEVVAEEAAGEPAEAEPEDESGMEEAEPEDEAAEAEEYAASFTRADDGNNPGLDSGIDLSEMFHFPEDSHSYVHSTNKHQAVITENMASRKGYMWYKYQINLEKSFQIESRIYLGADHGGNSAEPRGADGLTFVMHNDPAGLEAVGDTGGSLGLGSLNNDTNKVITNGIALEFDTYYNNGSSTGDPQDYEIAKKYNNIKGGSATTGDSFSDIHLFHVALLQLPLPRIRSSNYITSAASGWTNTQARKQQHAMTSIFTTQDLSGRTLRKDFGNRSGTGNTGNGWTAQIYDNLEIADVFGRWHDLKISWNAQSNTFAYEIGNSGTAVHAAESYTLSDPAKIDELFGFNTGDEKKVYWGFTGSTGSYFNYQSVAITQLPAYVDAAASREAGLVKADGSVSYGTETVEAYPGERVSYRAEVAVKAQNSDIPLAAVYYHEVLDGVRPEGEVRIEWERSDGGKEQELVEVVYDLKDYDSSMGLKAYFNEVDGNFYVYGLGTLGESAGALVSESLNITYQVLVSEEEERLVNNNNGYFYSGTKEAISAGAVPIQVRARIEPDPGELQLIIPAVISFGAGAISPVMKNYPATELDQLVVLDTREEKGWELKAKLESPLQNDEGTVKYEEALIYMHSGNESILNTTDMVSIERADHEVDEITDIKEKWYTGETPSGIFLRFSPGQGRTGHYKAIIVWELQDVPGQNQ